MEVNEIADKIHQNAKDHGWWDDGRSPAEIIALCHSELSEALEEMRNSRDAYYIDDANANYIDDASAKPEGWAVEMIDCVIRIFDYLSYCRIDIEKILESKHVYNKTRPYKHGGKVF